MDIKVGKEFWEIAPDEHRLAAEYTYKIWKKAGKPKRLETEGAWKVMDALVQIWIALYPDEFDYFRQTIKEDQEVERSVSEANRRDGGYFSIAYPDRLHQMIKVYFPEEKLQNHDLILKFIRRYPILKVTKHNL